MSEPPLTGRPLPGGGPLLPENEPDDRSGHLHRQFIGILGFLLPLLLWVIAGWRAVPSLARWDPLDSISAYYHTGAVAAFVGTVIALAVFFYTYRGYGNEYGRRDRIAAMIAGTAAVFVASFPTRAPEPLANPPWWTEATGAIHYVAAVVLFGSFTYFALVLFPISKTRPAARQAGDKKLRNRVYRVCGLIMLGCVVWAVAAGFADAPIFWPEAIALEAFAVSWLVKGRADVTVVKAYRRARHYAGHPAEAIDRLRRVIGG